MRLSRFLIASLFIFFFAFGIRSQVFAACPTPDTANPEYANCVNGGAGYFYSHLAVCQAVTCSASYTPGAFPGQGVPEPVKKLVIGSCDTQQNAEKWGASLTCYDVATKQLRTSFGVLPNIMAFLIADPFGSWTGTNGAVTLGVPPKGAQVAQTTGGGAVGSLINLTAQMSGKPMISSTEYVADVIHTIQNPLGAQPAYAQGLGFSALAPALSLWKVFRNIAYFFFVVIFLIIGFLIMFRSKIGGQAAVTVQQALPKIIVSLLLVTFSYAIAGLLIDIMYIIIYMVIGIFTPLFGSVTAGGSMFGGESLTKVAFQNNIIQNSLSLLTNGVVGNVAGALGNITVGALGLTEQDVGGAALQGFANITFTLILAIVVLVSMFRVFFELLKAYVFIFFLVIFAPLQLLLGALPGQNTFGKWIKALLENLLVFPTIILLIFIAYFFTGAAGVQNTNAANQNLGFSAPQLTSNQGADGYRVYQSLIALGAILAMPEVLKVTKGLMKGQIDVSPTDLAKNFTQGVPLASRAVMAPAGGLALGGYQFGRDFVRKARSGALQRDPLGALRSNFEAATGKEGFRRGVGYGLTGAEAVSTGLRANQPDVLNPLRSAIDKRFNPKVAEETKRRQDIEDAVDILNASRKKS